MSDYKLKEMECCLVSRDNKEYSKFIPLWIGRELVSGVLANDKNEMKETSLKINKFKFKGI